LTHHGQIFIQKTLEKSRLFEKITPEDTKKRFKKNKNKK
jgi:hypothetical protein